MSHTSRRSFLVGAAGALGVATLRAQTPAPIADHHQHLFSPLTAELSPMTKRVDGADLVRFLDTAGIKRAVVLSVAYQFSNPNRPRVDDEYAKVRAENDWTAQQVAQHADRLVGFCSVNPLRDYADGEIRRGAGIASLRAGVKMHFGNSDVQLDDPTHIAQVKAAFARANASGMAIVVHMRGSVNQQRPHGAMQARTFIEQLLPAAPDVPVQVAHLAGAGGYDEATDQAMGVFADAIARSDARTKRLYFDASGVTLRDGLKNAGMLVARMRRAGLERILFGSDGNADILRPVEAWMATRQLPLSEAEFTTVARNVAPYA